MHKNTKIFDNPEQRLTLDRTLLNTKRKKIVKNQKKS